jgi:hypothetical protein
MRNNQSSLLPPIPFPANDLLKLLDVNARYCSILGNVAASFLRDLAGTLEGPWRNPEEPRSVGDRSNFVERGNYVPDVARHHEPVSPPGQAVAVVPEPAAQATILLDAEAGHTAIGVFMVGNHLNHEILVHPQVSPFYEPPGTTSLPRVAFEPDMVRLAPRERVLIRISATVDRSLQPDVRYRCEVSVPSLDASRIPVVVRRRSDRVNNNVEINRASAPETRVVDSAAGDEASELPTVPPSEDTSETYAARTKRANKTPRKKRKATVNK